MTLAVLIGVAIVLLALWLALEPRHHHRKETRAQIVWSREDQPAQMEEHVMADVQIHVGHSRLAHFKAEADDGSVVPPAGPVVWSSDDPTKVEVDPTPDGLSCTVKGLVITTASVMVHATDGLSQATSAPIDVIPEPETHAEITFDDEQ